jgi:hypothetical protein
MLTVSVQEYAIADVRPVFREGGRVTCSAEPRETDEIRASVRSNEKDHHERKDEP